MSISYSVDEIKTGTLKMSDRSEVTRLLREQGDSSKIQKLKSLGKISDISDILRVAGVGRDSPLTSRSGGNKKTQPRKFPGWVSNGRSRVFFKNYLASSSSSITSEN